MWMPPPVPAAPTQWQLVPVETAKPKEPEKVVVVHPTLHHNFKDLIYIFVAK
jgi:hypothetical protein